MAVGLIEVPGKGTDLSIASTFDFHTNSSEWSPLRKSLISLQFLLVTIRTSIQNEDAALLPIWAPLFHFNWCSRSTTAHHHYPPRWHSSMRLTNRCIGFPSRLHDIPIWSLFSSTKAVFTHLGQVHNKGFVYSWEEFERGVLFHILFFSQTGMESAGVISPLFNYASG